MAYDARDRNTTQRTTVYSIEDVPHLLLRKYFDALEDKRKLEAAWLAQGITGAVSRIEKVEIRNGAMTTPAYSLLPQFFYKPPRPDSLWHSYSGSSLDVGAPSEVDRELATRTRCKAKKKSQP